MDLILLLFFAIIVFVVILFINILLKKHFCRDKKQNTQQIRPQQDILHRAQVVRNQRARLRAARPHYIDDDEQNHNEYNEELRGPILSEVQDIEKLGTKKRAKLEAKAERKAQREIEEQTREERKKREELAEEERRKQIELQEFEEKKLEEEERKRKEDQEKKDNEEYLKIKAMFSVDEEGFESNDCQNEENLLQTFINFIKENKVVILEDLASYFKMKTQVVIDRIQQLQKDGTLTGVIDDRGKFIYVSLNELKAIAQFIKQRGRVSITELADNSNELINFFPQQKISNA